jgi:hypothetical protein
MRYHLETIPVIDAYQAQSECPLCDLKRQVEQSCLERFLGESVMEPAVRIEVNKKGFCGPHFAEMFQMQNRLGLALMTHTHLLETLSAPRNAGFPKKKAFLKKTQTAPDTCAVCDRLSDTMNRFLYTALHLWKTNGEFRMAFSQSKGHCLPHHHQLLRMAREEWPAESARAFCEALQKIQLENLERIEKELKWFTEKFDYRNADKPWDESKDSLQRAILKLRGYNMPPERGQCQQLKGENAKGRCPLEPRSRDIVP